MDQTLQRRTDTTTHQKRALLIINILRDQAPVSDHNRFLRISDYLVNINNGTAKELETEKTKERHLEL